MKKTLLAFALLTSWLPSAYAATTEEAVANLQQQLADKKDNDLCLQLINNLSV